MQQSTCIVVNYKNKKIPSIKVTADERVHGRKAVSELIDDAIKSNKIIGKLFAYDGAYDGNNIFRCIKDNGYGLY